MAETIVELEVLSAKRFIEAAEKNGLAPARLSDRKAASTVTFLIFIDRIISALGHNFFGFRHAFFGKGK